MATYSDILAWKSLGRRSLVGYSPWGHKEWDTTEKLGTCQSWHWTQRQLVQRLICLPRYCTGSVLQKSPGLCAGIEPVARMNKTEPLLKAWKFLRLNKQDLGLGGREIRWMGKLELVRNFIYTSILGCCFFVFFFFAIPRGLWDLSSLIRDGASAVKAWSPNHWTVREFPCTSI